MTDLELNALADGIIQHLKSSTETPRDGLVTLGIAVIKFHDSFIKDEKGFAKFAEEFKQGMIDSRADAIRMKMQ